MVRPPPPPMIRIIDHKKVLMTQDEFNYYEEICKGYDRPNLKGKDLFQDHFEVNKDGIIIFVKPPHKKFSSMEVYTFLISIMVNQQLRISQEQVHSLVLEADKKFKEKVQEIDLLKQELKLLKEGVERSNSESLKNDSKKTGRKTNGRRKQNKQ